MKYVHYHYIDVALVMLKQLFWLIINIFNAKLWGITIKSNCRFRGKVLWNTLPGSKVHIGEKCSFMSTHKSNLIGVYTPCMISTIDKSAQIIIGTGCGFSGTVIGCAKNVTLGNNVRCGANTLITDSDWHTDDVRAGENDDVIIEDNVWLGYGVVVLKGVTIGRNSVIGARSVVTKDIPADVVAAGNPCKVIKELND